jgi:hypothetical protein
MPVAHWRENMWKSTARWVFVLGASAVGACAPASEATDIAEVPHDNVTLVSAQVPARPLAEEKMVLEQTSPAFAKPVLKAARATAAPSLMSHPHTWKITGHVNAYVSAMEDDEASELDGHYVMSNASFVTPWECCDAPHDGYSDASAEEWFGSFDDRGLTSQDRQVLGVASGATVRVHDITCAGGEQIEVVEISPVQICPRA